MSDDKLTIVALHAYPGWLNFCEPLGIHITPSPKIAKRLTVTTRTAYLYTRRKVGELQIGEVAPNSFTDYDEVSSDVSEKFLDGANVISMELLDEMVTNGTHTVEDMFMNSTDPNVTINPHDRAYYNNKIYQAGSFSLRVTTPDGLIKGDALVSTREKMGGYDILYCSENIKHELKTDDFVFVLAEPHPVNRNGDKPDFGVVWTDDQTLSWLGEWLYPIEQLKAAFDDYIDRIKRDLALGKYPKFFTNFNKLDDEYGTISQFQHQSLLWEKYGPSPKNRDASTLVSGENLKQSIFLQERIAEGARQHLRKKRRWPVMCAAYLHVGTDSWLHMAGYDDADGHPWPFQQPITPRGKVWVHEPSGRLIYNDLDFAELYTRHGGWDLDDSVKAMWRTIDGVKKIVIVRSPNSWGEYDIKDYVEGTFAPVWVDKFDNEITFPKIDTSIPRPRYIEELLADGEIIYRYDDLAPATIGAPVNPDSLHGKTIYTQQMVEAAVKTAVDFIGLFGRRANADMVYFYTMKRPRKRQLSSIESIVDASTQQQSALAAALITEDTEDIQNRIIASGLPVDETLWLDRLKKLNPSVRYQHLGWSSMVSAHSDMCSIAKKDMEQSIQNSVDNINPMILELGKMFAAIGKEYVDWYYKLVTLPRDENEPRSALYHRINDIMYENLVTRTGGNHVLMYNVVLGMARHVYTVKRGAKFQDTVIFQLGTQKGRSFFDLYIGAIAFYGIGHDNWTAEVICSVCSSTRLVDHPVIYQQSFVEYRCPNCPK